MTRRFVDSDANRMASRSWWDRDADSYQAEHGDFLGDVDFVWCPEGVREADVHKDGNLVNRWLRGRNLGSSRYP